MKPLRVDASADTALNRICPYFTMFPLRFPYGILRRHAVSEDVVLDPFCGRGTTNYAARLLGLRSYGIDVNPVAVAIARAKAPSVTPDSIMAEYELLLASTGTAQAPIGEFWRWAFHPDVLAVLARLRHALMNAPRTPARDALCGVILGALHGPRNKHRPSYLSNQILGRSLRSPTTPSVSGGTGISCRSQLMYETSSCAAPCATTPRTLAAERL